MMKEKLLAFVLAISIVVSAISVLMFNVSADYEDYDYYYDWRDEYSYENGYYYDIVEGSAMIRAVKSDVLSGVVDIPPTLGGKAVTCIGSYVFDGCINITSVKIPDTILTIGSAAFSSSSIKNIEIPDSVECISDGAFYWCDELESITIGKNVTQIGEGAFYKCFSLKTITIDPENKYYYSAGNCIIETKTKTLIAGSNASIIPNDIKHIDQRVFEDCIGLKTAIIPDSVETIGTGAFYGCAGLTNVIIGNSITTIEENTFYGCVALSSIQIPENVTSIGRSAFNGCVNLEDISIGDNILKLSASAFANTAFWDVSEPGIVYLGKYALGYKFSHIDSWGSIDVDLKEGTLGVADGAFNWFQIIYVKSLRLPDGLRFIGSSAFCTAGITNIKIPDSVISIGSEAFKECTNLAEVSFPENLISIGKDAFIDTAWYNNQPNGLIYTGNAIYEYKGNMPKNTNLTIKEGIKIIPERLFYYCSGLRSIILPDSVETIGDYAFSGCNGLISATFGSNLTSIGEEAFVSCNSLTGIVLPEGLLTLGYCAFAHCNNLRSINIPDGIAYIGDKAFQDCNELTNIKIGTGVKYIGEDAFDCCRSLKSIELPEGLESIGNRSFSGCYNMKSIKLPESLVTIGEEAFGGCSSITNITIPNGVIYIGDYAFSGCHQIKKFNIPKNVSHIGKEAFGNCNELSSITVEPENQKYRSSGNCLIDIGTKTLIKGFKSSVIPNDESIEIIGDSAFSGVFFNDNESSIELILPDGLISIGNYAFYDCSGIGTLKIPDTVISIGDNAFESCGISDLIIPDSIISIGNQAFYMSRVTSLSLGKNVSKLGRSAFADCPIESIEVKEGNQKYHVSGNCLIETESKTIIIGTNSGVIPNDGSVTVIGDSAFVRCREIISLEIPEGITTIGAWAFDGCWNIEDIVIPKSLKTIGSGAFWQGYNITVYYCGSESEWNDITIDDWGNTAITNAKIYYNYVPHSHNYSKTWSSDKTNHWKTCSMCEKTSSFGKHTYDKGTVNKATQINNGSKVYKCSVCKRVLKTDTIYAAKTIKLSTETYTYDGKVKTPAVTVKDSKGKTLKKDTDYTVSYPNGRKNVGTYKVTINFKGNYKGSKPLNFTINPKNTSIKKVTSPAKKQIKVTLKKYTTQTTGYQIQYSTDKNFKKNNKTVSIGNKTTSKTIKNLTSKKTYYVRIRTYKTVRKIKYYSSWSTAKKVKTK